MALDGVLLDLLGSLADSMVQTKSRVLGTTMPWGPAIRSCTDH